MDGAAAAAKQWKEPHTDPQAVNGAVEQQPQEARQLRFDDIVAASAKSSTRSNWQYDTSDGDYIGWLEGHPPILNHGLDPHARSYERNIGHLTNSELPDITLDVLALPWEGTRRDKVNSHVGMGIEICLDQYFMGASEDPEEQDALEALGIPIPATLHKGSTISISKTYFYQPNKWKKGQWREDKKQWPPITLEQDIYGILWRNQGSYGGLHGCSGSSWGCVQRGIWTMLHSMRTLNSMSG